MFDKIYQILEEILGVSRQGGYNKDTDQYQFNCPCCAEENGGKPDNKYNLEVNLRIGKYNCWKCGDTDGTKGNIRYLVKKYGTPLLYKRYKDEITFLIKSKMYDINLFSAKKEEEDETFVVLPKTFSKIDLSDCPDKLKEYLEKRKIDQSIIDKFNLGYTSWNEYDRMMRNRIIIPSYDEYGDLNYWVARDYTGKSKTKILNPDVDKKSIIFNEYNLNWYEPITIVEGPFDHIVVPNSIPLLGKTLDEECYAFKKLVEKAHSYINIMLDSDARGNAIKLYCFLEKYFPGRVKIISIPYPYDPADYHYHYGRLGIIELLNSGKEIDKNVINMALLGNEERKKHCKSSKQKNSVYNAIDMLS